MPGSHPDGPVPGFPAFAQRRSLRTAGRHRQFRTWTLLIPWRRYSCVFAGRLIGAADAALAPRGHNPANVRVDPEHAGRLLRATAWLTDAAAGLIAEQAGDFGASDPAWTAYIEDLTRISREQPG